MAFDVTQDNSGMVTIIPTAEGTVYFDVTFGDDTPEPAQIDNGETIDHTYAEGTYTGQLVNNTMHGFGQFNYSNGGFYIEPTLIQKNNKNKKKRIWDI